MTREEIFEAMGRVADRHVDAAVRYDPDGAYASGEGADAVGRRKHIKRMAVLALAAALVLALGATAWAALDGAEWFKSWFASASGTELTEGQKEYIDQAAVGVGQSVTAGGWTVTLQSAMTDGEHVFMDLTARPEDGETRLHDTTLYGQLTSGDPDAPEEYFYGPSASTFDQKGGVASQMEEKTVDPEYLGRKNRLFLSPDADAGAADERT